MMNEKDLLKIEGVMAFVEGGDWYDLPQATQDTLYEHFLPEMSYGIAKARTGDPDVWIAERLSRLL
jgi:hypothetical protein